MTQQKQQTRNLLKRLVELVAPPEQMTLSEWADKHRVLSKESSAEAGPWRTSRAPYQKGPMDAISDGTHQTIIMMWGSQLGKTDIQLNAIGYFTHHEPSPIIMVQPTIDLGEDFSKDRLAPMYRDSKVLAKLVGGEKSKDKSNTIRYKSFPGGRINIAGANSPRSLASKPIRVVLADEIDGYPASAGKEGDPVSLVSVRQETFTDRVRILVSTPTIKGASRIESFYEDSTQEEWHVPCPSCDELQPFKWVQLKFEYDKDKRQCTSTSFACKVCGALHAEMEWKMDYANRGRWIAKKDHAHTRGFHLNALASTFVTWEHIVEKFMKAKREGPESLKTFINTSLAESWEEKGEQLDEEVLYNRREMYHADVPDGVKILTAAVDTQDDRFEVEIQGWGAGHENWRIEYRVVWGDLKQPRVWQELDEFLQRTWTDLQGRKFPIAVTCMDSGGHFTNEVYKFCKDRAARLVFAIKGEGDGDGQKKPLIAGRSTSNRYKSTYIRLGVNEGKAKVFSSLQQPLVDEYGDKMPGYVHFPLDTDDKRKGYDMDYFQGLTAEALQTRYRSGVAYTAWVKIRPRNEPLDLAVYNRAAIELIDPDLDTMDPYCSAAVDGARASPATQQRRRKRGLISSH